MFIKAMVNYFTTAIFGESVYFEKVLGEKRTTYNIDRPKKEKALPVVL